MDAALKARNLGSATARKLRMQERQLEKHQAHQDRQDRKRQIMYEGRRSDDFDADSTYSSSSNPDLDFSAETPSEYSLRTPEESSPELERLEHDVQVMIHGSTHDEMTDLDLAKEQMKDLGTPVSRSQSGPKMQATLTTVADWNYDRFSVLVDPHDLSTGAEAEEEAASSSDSDSDDGADEFSPIEVAVPISYSLPKMKPAMVRIMTTQSRSQSLRINKSSTNRPSCRRHTSEQLLSSLPHDTFKAGEARSFEAADSSQETLSSASYSTQDTRSVSQASQGGITVSRSTSRTSYSEQGDRNPKRKSSLPLLFGNNKTGHSRMSSIKKFIRSSTLGPLGVGQSYEGLQRYPSTTTLETHFEAHRSSMEQIRETVVDAVVRPKTARAPSPSVSSQRPALPSTVWALRTEPFAQPSNGSSEPNTGKSTSKLRPRSSSIGQALKSLGTTSKRSDSSAPPVPTIQIPQPREVNIDSFPTPPLTPRNPKRTSHYTVFPTTNKRTSSLAVGLGLRY